MKAAVLREIKKPMSIEEVGIDEPGRGQVLVKTAAAGVCHSDLHFIEGSWPLPLPAILGHEGAGVVEQVGEGVNTVQPGDHVVLLWTPGCGRCFYCSTGRPNLCQTGRTTSQHLHLDGQALAPFLSMSAFAEKMVTSEDGVVKIREDAPLDRACLVGCAVMTGVGAVTNTARVPAGSSVAVLGAGGVGLNVIQGASLVGAAKIIAIDVRESKLAMAKEFGATDVINAAEQDPVAAVRAMTGGGADFAFEVIGLPAAISQAFDMVRRGGEAVVVGMAPLGSKAEIDTTSLFIGEKVLRGCAYGSTRPRVDMPKIIDLYMAGKLNLDALVSRRYGLEGINDAFDALRGGDVARSVITFG